MGCSYFGSNSSKPFSTYQTEPGIAVRVRRNSSGSILVQDEHTKYSQSRESISKFETGDLQRAVNVLNREKTVSFKILELVQNSVVGGELLN